MKRVKHKQQAGISRHLTKSYILLFPFFILIFVIVMVLAFFISNQWMEKSMPITEFPAEKIIRADAAAIDVTEVLRRGGSAALVDGEGNVTPLGGDSLFEKQKLSMTEWTEFLINSAACPGIYDYSVAYEEQGEFWLVIRFPVSIHIRFSIAVNQQSQEYGKAMGFFCVLMIALLLLLFFSTLLYAKVSARAFVVPLRKLCGMVKQMIGGNYHETENAEGLTGEFLWLKEDISTLSANLREEKTLREHLEHEKTQMLLDISHDLRNPLATIMGYAETLYTDKALEEQKKYRYAEVIWKSSIRANARLEDLFTYSKLKHSGFHPVLAKGDICEFMREQASLFFADFEAAGMVTEFEIPETEICLSFDEKLLARAFANLFVNSIRYNEAGVVFRILLTEEKEIVSITVEDNGVGMDETIAKTIFDPFTRGDRARNSETGGSGLGLAITKKIIEAHSGSIELFTAPDEGCRFVIKLKK